MEFINQMEPCFDEKEREALNEYMINGGWGTEFKQTRKFEEMIKEFTGAKHCWIMTNGTLSLSAALIAVGVSVGDEVICPDYTMVATPNAVELIGAKAVFVDIDKAVFMALDNTLNYLKTTVHGQQKEIDEMTVKAYEYYKNKK